MAKLKSETKKAIELEFNTSLPWHMQEIEPTSRFTYDKYV